MTNKITGSAGLAPQTQVQSQMLLSQSVSSKSLDFWIWKQQSYNNYKVNLPAPPPPTSIAADVAALSVGKIGLEKDYRIAAGDMVRFEKAGGPTSFFYIEGHKWYHKLGDTGPVAINFDPDRSIDDLRFGDFNGDGITDVFAVSPTGQWLVSYSGKTPYQNLNSDGSRTIDELRIGDFDGDGKSDVFAVNNGQWMYSSGGIGSYTKIQHDVTKSIEDLKFGDFDGDKKTDVFSIEAGRWRYSSAGRGSYVSLETDGSRDIDMLRFADLDGNGRTDVFCHRGATMVSLLPWII